MRKASLQLTVMIVPTFASQFTQRNPEPSLISACWSRFGTLQTHLDRNHVLAVTYMIHLESRMDKEQLEFREGGPYISDRRRKIIKHFGDWVVCQCGCRREWSYANGSSGLQRNVNSERKCKVDKWMRAPWWKKWMYSKAAEFETDNRHMWFGRICK